MNLIKTMKNKSSLYSVRLRKIYYVSIKRRQLRKMFSDKKFIKRIPKEIKKLKKDLFVFPEEIIDVLLIAQPGCTSEVRHLINSSLHLDSKIHNTVRKYYEIGKAKDVFGYGDKVSRWV